MKQRYVTRFLPERTHRRGFVTTTGKYLAGGLAAAGLIEYPGTRYALFGQTAAGNQPESATLKIARFAINSRYDNLPPKALEWAHTAILDCLGVAVAGSREESSRICAQLARDEKPKEEATLYGHGFGTSAAQAAFTNGISAHATDFDHSFVIGGQPSAPIIPAVFALAESLGASGKQVLEAYVVGFEVAAQLTLAGPGTAQDGGG